MNFRSHIFACTCQWVEIRNSRDAENAKCQETNTGNAGAVLFGDCWNRCISPLYLYCLLPPRLAQHWLWKSIWVFRRTFRTKPLQHIIDTVQCKSFRHLNYWSRYILKTESFVTFFAMEVGMQVFYFARTTFATYGILQGAGTVVDTMYQMAGQK